MNTHTVLLFSIISALILSPMSIINTPKSAYSFSDFDDFLTQYGNASSEEKQQVIDDFIEWQTINGGFPAIQNSTEAIFIYYSIHSTSSASVIGDFNLWDELIPMTRLETGKNFFYKKMTFEPDARIDYKFVKDGDTWILDPRNPNTCEGGFGDNSELSMPQFIQPTEIISRTNITHGKIIQLDDPWNSPRVQVYLPPDYDQNKTYASFYTSDGSEYLSYASAATILDNLIADKLIDLVIGVFINPLGDRIEWYNCNPEYLTFLDSLVTYIDATYSTNKSTDSRLHLGDSMGGLVSAYVGLERNQTFKLIGSHSGAFWVGTDYQIIQKYVDAPTSLNLKMWFSAGTYEQSIYNDTQKIANAGVEKGWSTKTVYLHEGHSWGAWRHTFGDMMEFFFPHTDKYDPEPLNSTSTNTTSSNDENKRTIDSGSSLLYMSIVGLSFFELLKRKKRNMR
ncbi:MAG: alpha/beta hydrolase-fold protein [Promethearchaeota archaeon]